MSEDDYEDPELQEVGFALFVVLVCSAGLLLLHHGVVFALTLGGQEITIFTEFAGYVLVISATVVVAAIISDMEADPAPDADALDE